MEIKQNHKHTWLVRGENEEGLDETGLICENCGIDYDAWFNKMIGKGYTIKQLERFEN